MSLVFPVGSCVLFYMLAQLESLADTPDAAGMYEFIKVFLRVDLSGVSRLAEHREVLWRSVFLFTFKAELFWVFVVIVRAGPGLIADDLKSRALPIYFARPVTPLTYLAGKWMVVACYIGLVVLVPNLLALILGTLVTGGLQTFGQTLGLGWDLVVTGIGVMVFGGAVILALSSLSSDRRYVTVGWVAVCLLPLLAQAILFDVLPEDATRGWLGSVSLFRDITVMADWVFGIREAWESTPLPREVFDKALGRPISLFYPASVLLAFMIGSFCICYRRVLRFSRSAASV
jgi:ABC-type transport system involved in multi-copper enzyme maturation permease subunit